VPTRLANTTLTIDRLSRVSDGGVDPWVVDMVVNPLMRPPEMYVAVFADVTSLAPFLPREVRPPDVHTL
jgi:hypothetical protein